LLALLCLFGAAAKQPLQPTATAKKGDDPKIGQSLDEPSGVPFGAISFFYHFLLNPCPFAFSLS
jgi:hypothetical protein